MRLTHRVFTILASLLSIQGAMASHSGPIKVLVMHWYDREYFSNDDFDRTLQAALSAAAPEGVEYYSEYLETNKFPGEDQARLLSEYLRQKYAGKRLDVIISGVSETLGFLLKHRYELFPSVPIVFATERPVPEAVLSKAAATGFTFGNAFSKTLNLALKWHRGTKQLFVVSGTLNHDKAVESIVRDNLRTDESRVTITYLTDLTPDELTARVRSLPKDSLILYVWQQVLDAQGRLLEAQDVLARVALEAKVPVYGRSQAMIGRGIVGGYVWTHEGNAAKLADITMRVVKGTRPKDIPVEIGPDFPMFDWRQLQRWRIGEDRLPAGSIIRFRGLTTWQQDKWRILGIIALVVLQSALIGALLILRRRAHRRAVALVEVQRVLQESEERFRRIFEEGPLGVALVGKDYRFLRVNRALCQMVGYPEEELTQKTFADITHPYDVRADVELAERLFMSEIPVYSMQKRYVKKNGGIMWINLTASVIRDHDGEPLYGLAMMEDITEVKRNQEEAFARQKLESVGTLAGGIAHDFNNLLGGILAEAECVEADLPPDSSLIAEVGRIKASTIRGSEIVRELMVYSGQEQSKLEPINVSLLVEEMLALLKVSISKRVVLDVDLPRDLPAVLGNASQIRQVVMNLVINASEAIGDNDGVITVRTSQVTEREAQLSSNSTNLNPGDSLQLEVSDTGSGIAKETQAKIFDPFFSTKFAGRGLGLAVVQGIVRTHEGAIHLSSEPGRGTTFRVLLPCAEATTGHYARRHPASMSRYVQFKTRPF